MNTPTKHALVLTTAEKEQAITEWARTFYIQTTPEAMGELHSFVNRAPDTLAWATKHGLDVSPAAQEELAHIISTEAQAQTPAESPASCSGRASQDQGPELALCKLDCARLRETLSDLEVKYKATLDALTVFQDKAEENPALFYSAPNEEQPPEVESQPRIRTESKRNR